MGRLPCHAVGSQGAGEWAAGAQQAAAGWLFGVDSCCCRYQSCEVPANARLLQVNDLDLTVRAAGFNGIPLLGNGGSVSSPDHHDHENNVEQVALEGVPAGLVSIVVDGYSVFTPGGAPSYALVVTGDFDGTLVPPGQSGGAAPGECTITLAAIVGGPAGLTNAANITFDFSTTTGNSAGVSFECKLGDAQGNLTAPGTQNWTVRGEGGGPGQPAGRAAGASAAFFVE